MIEHTNTQALAWAHVIMLYDLLWLRPTKKLRNFQSELPAIFSLKSSPFYRYSWTSIYHHLFSLRLSLLWQSCQETSWNHRCWKRSKSRHEHHPLHEHQTDCLSQECCCLSWTHSVGCYLRLSVCPVYRNSRILLDTPYQQFKSESGHFFGEINIKENIKTS